VDRLWKTSSRQPGSAGGAKTSAASPSRKQPVAGWGPALPVEAHGGASSRISQSWPNLPQQGVAACSTGRVDRCRFSKALGCRGRMRVEAAVKAGSGGWPGPAGNTSSKASLSAGRRWQALVHLFNASTRLASRKSRAGAQPPGLMATSARLNTGNRIGHQIREIHHPAQPPQRSEAIAPGAPPSRLSPLPAPDSAAARL